MARRFGGQWLVVVGGPKTSTRLRFNGLRAAFKAAVSLLLQHRRRVSEEFLQMIGPEARASLTALDVALREERYAHALRHWNKFRVDFYASKNCLRLEWHRELR